MSPDERELRDFLRHPIRWLRGAIRYLMSPDRRY